MFEDVLAAVKELEKFPPLPVRIEMAEDVWSRFLASLPPRVFSETLATRIPVFKGLPVVVPGMQRSGEWAFVYRSRS